MSISRLVAIIDDHAGPVGFARRCRVKEAYGLGFEGAVKHAETEGFVLTDPVGDGLGLTPKARNHLLGNAIN